MKGINVSLLSSDDIKNSDGKLRELFLDNSCSDYVLISGCNVYDNNKCSTILKCDDKDNLNILQRGRIDNKKVPNEYINFYGIKPVLYLNDDVLSKLKDHFYEENGIKYVNFGYFPMNILGFYDNLKHIVDNNLVDCTCNNYKGIMIDDVYYNNGDKVRINKCRVKWVVDGDRLVCSKVIFPINKVDFLSIDKNRDVNSRVNAYCNKLVSNMLKDEHLLEEKKIRTSNEFENVINKIKKLEKYSYDSVGMYKHIKSIVDKFNHDLSDIRSNILNIYSEDYIKNSTMNELNVILNGLENRKKECSLLEPILGVLDAYKDVDSLSGNIDVDDVKKCLRLCNNKELFDYYRDLNDKEYLKILDYMKGKRKSIEYKNKLEFEKYFMTKLQGLLMKMQFYMSYNSINVTKDSYKEALYIIDKKNDRMTRLYYKEIRRIIGDIKEYDSKYNPDYILNHKYCDDVFENLKMIIVDLNKVLYEYQDKFKKKSDFIRF